MTGTRQVDRLTFAGVTGIMVWALTLSLVTLLERYIPTWHPSYLPVFCGLAAAGAMHSRYGSDKLPGLHFRLLELATLLVMRQLWADVVQGRAPLQDGAPRFDAYQVGLFALASSLVFLSWLLAVQTARDVHQLGDSPEFYGPDLSPTRRLGTRFLAGGVLLFALAGVSQPHVARVLGIPGVTAPPTLNVLVYFLAGIGLLVLAQHSMQERRREHGEITFEGDFARMWLRRTLAPVALVTVLALGLPSGRTYAVVDLGGQVGTALHSLFPHGNTVQDSPSQSGFVDTPISHGPGPKESQVPAGKETSRPSDPWAIWSIDLSTITGFMVFAFKLLLLWLAVLGSIGYRVYALRRRERYHAPPSVRVPGFLEGFRSFLAALRRLIHPPAPVPLRAAPRSSSPPRPRVRLRRPRHVVPRVLSPQEQVVRWYLDIAKLAKRRHLRRRHSETPYEYSATLAPHLTASRDDVQAVTDEFVKARYSPREVTRERVKRLHPSWRRARREVRRIE